MSTPAQGRAYVRSCLDAVEGDPTQYGTRAAMDDLDAVRAALGYAQLDLYGGSYGATAAQVYLKRHPSSVRTVILDGATEIDVPFYGRFAANAERALDQLARLCAADSGCRKIFPNWRLQFDRLVAAWDARPVHNRKGQTTTGTGLAGVVQQMLLDVNTAVSIPLVVARAAKGDYEPLNRQIPKTGGPGTTRQLMYWSIWCNEPWVGLDSRGPWGTDFDRLTSGTIASARQVCALLPKRAERAADWTLPHATVPVLALAGGADPQDPISNLPRLKTSFPNSRSVVVPYYGHTVGQFGCLRDVVARFVARASVRGLDTSCVAAIVPPPFPLS